MPKRKVGSASTLTSLPPSFSDNSLKRLPFGLGNIFIFALIIAIACGTQPNLSPRSDQVFHTDNCDHICSYVCTTMYPVWTANYTQCKKEQDSCCCFCGSAPKQNVVGSCKEYCKANCKKHWSGYKEAFYDCQGVPYECNCLARFTVRSPYFILTILSILLILGFCGLVAKYYYKVLANYHIRNRNVMARPSEVESDHLKGEDSPPDDYPDDSEDVSNNAAIF